MGATPREIAAWLTGHAAGEKNAWGQAMWAAWHGASFRRAKKLPSLRKIMQPFRDKRHKPAPMNREQWIKWGEMMVAAFGGKDLRKDKR